MRPVLQEKTNTMPEKSSKDSKIKTKVKHQTDKENVIDFIRSTISKTNDFNLKYDLTKCIEIIEGKENQDVEELRIALEEALIENEKLQEEKNDLIVENCFLREKLDVDRN